MRAVILAAGVGKRLASVHPEQPKCLLAFGGKTLLQRHIEALTELGVEGVDLVLGFQAGLVIRHLGELRPELPVELHINGDFEQGSLVSLSVAAPVLNSGKEVLLMDADVLYSPAILSRLIEHPHSNLLLQDQAFEAGDEPVKICCHQGRLVEFRKRLSPLLRYDSVGESVGFFRFSPQMASALALQCQFYLDAGLKDTPHEEAIRDLILAAPEQFVVEDVSGTPWIEIDFPEDIARAEQQILPRCQAMESRV